MMKAIVLKLNDFTVNDLSDWYQEKLMTAELQRNWRMLRISWKEKRACGNIH